MALIFNSKTFTLDRQTPDANDYVGANHTLSIKDVVRLSRVFPKPIPGFKGVARPKAKFTRTVVIDAVTGATSDAILDISGSLPVGMTEADITALLADAAAFLATADASNLVKKLDISA